MAGTTSARQFLSFVNASPTRKDQSYVLPQLDLCTNIIVSVAFHAVQSAKELLIKAGFHELKVFRI